MEIADLCHQLALLLHAGVLLSDGLHLLAEEESISGHKKMISDIAQEVEDGIPLSTAFKNAA